MKAKSTSLRTLLLVLLGTMLGTLKVQAQEAYAVYTSDNTTLTFYFDNNRSTHTLSTETVYDLNTGTNDPGWKNRSSKVKTVIFDPSFANARPTTTNKWFWGMLNLSSIQGMLYLNTSEVTRMGSMFYSCSSLTSLDLSHFDTRKVEDMGSMFYGCEALKDVNLSSFDTGHRLSFNWMFGSCKSLKTLDLSSFNTAGVYNMTNMFSGCLSLTTIYVSDEWDASGVLDQEIFTGCSSLVGGAGTACDGVNNLGKAYARIDGGEIAPGYLTLKLYAYAVFTSDNTTLTFYYDNDKQSHTADTETVFELNADGTNPGWHQLIQNTYSPVRNVVFDKSFAYARPTSTYRWFFNMAYVEKIVGIEYLNTSEVTNMCEMFEGCYNLKNLDVSHFDTSKVIDMRRLFANCQYLTTLDVSHFDTKQVQSMWCMFLNCASLPALDVSNFNTENVRSMSAMFSNCNSLTSIDVSGFITDKVDIYGFTAMFFECKLLKSIDLSNFNTSQGEFFDEMFSGCESLVTIDLSSFDTSISESLYSMFKGCSSLKILDLTNFVTDKVNDMRSMFEGCSELEAIYVGDGWSTETTTEETEYTGSVDMFKECVKLVGGAGTVYDAAHTNYEYAHVDGGISNPGYFTQRQPEPYVVYNSENTSLTFYCDLLRNTHKAVTETVYDLNEGSNRPGWFVMNNTSISGVVFDPSFANACPTSTYNWFAEMPALTLIEGIEYLNTSEVTNMNGMFSRCGVISSLDLSGFDTQKVTDISYMFENSTNLTTIYVGTGWTTTSVISSAGMFRNCTSLVGGAGTAYSGDHVDGSYAHVDGGSTNPGYFTLKTNFLLGDVNSDGSVNVADVTALVNMLNRGNVVNNSVTDVDGDGNVNDNDVKELVNLILGSGLTIDLGLPSGTLWASRNVYASTPASAGGIFRWGENSSDPVSNPDWTNYFDTTDSGATFVKYNINDGKTVLDKKDDAASSLMGNGWCMPSIDQLQEILAECTWTPEIRNGVRGASVTGPNGNSIFLPVTNGDVGLYWLNSLNETKSVEAYGIYFQYADTEIEHGIASGKRFNYWPVRAVRAK